jgi:phospholipid/cholesterol/gamma-HCH transport system substrate-binding protein
MSRETAAARRVGLLVLAALAVGIAALAVLGDRQNLFVRKNRYLVRFERVNGLAVGSQVQLNGVNVGSVERVVLPSDMGEQMLEVRVAIDARYAERIREDSQARIKTLGLLGDKYLELVSGTPAAPIVPNGGVIPASPLADVDRLAETGQDVVESIARVATQLTEILGTIERGEGVLGKILMDREAGEKVSEQLDGTLAAVRKTAEGLDDRRGAVGRLLHDRELGDRLAGAVERLESLLAKADSGESAAGALLSDGATRERLDRTLANLETASASLASIAGKLAKDGSDALAPKLLDDEQFGREVAAELTALLRNLREVAEKVNKGDGSAARLINDPAFAEAVEDILVGINESKLLRWLIRNRQEKGIEKRYEGEVEKLESEGATPPPVG